MHTLMLPFPTKFKDGVYPSSKAQRSLRVIFEDVEGEKTANAQGSFYDFESCEFEKALSEVAAEFAEAAAEAVAEAAEAAEAVAGSWGQWSGWI